MRLESVEKPIQFLTDCTCGRKVNNTSHIIRDTLLSGIVDDEIRHEILKTADILNRPINKVIPLVESKEMTRNAKPQPEISALKSNAPTAPIRPPNESQPHPLLDRSKQSH